MISRRIKFISLFIVMILAIVMMPLSLYEQPRDEQAAAAVPVTAPPVIDIPPDPAPAPTPEPAPSPAPEPPAPEPDPTPEPPLTITVSAAGDITLGGVHGGNSYASFMREFTDAGEDYGYFLAHFKEIFEADDLTLANFEGTLTNHTVATRPTLMFRAPPEFAEVLSSSGVDAVSLANNHADDFGRTGRQDTRDALDAAGVAYFGESINTIVEVKGIKIGLFGYLTWNNFAEYERKITASIKELKDKGARLIIAYFHFGHELETKPDNDQKRMARHAVDEGAHLVLGAHPHVMQGIEVYNGRNIVYSLGNFSFAGNRYPLAGYDTYVFQQTFSFDAADGKLIEDNVTNIIPAHITSIPGQAYNNYQPIPATGAEAERIMNKLIRYNAALNPELYPGVIPDDTPSTPRPVIYPTAAPSTEPEPGTEPDPGTGYPPEFITEPVTDPPDLPDEPSTEPAAQPEPDTAVTQPDP